MLVVTKEQKQLIELMKENTFPMHRLSTEAREVLELVGRINREFLFDQNNEEVWVADPSEPLSAPWSNYIIRIKQNLQVTTQEELDAGAARNKALEVPPKEFIESLRYKDGSKARLTGAVIPAGTMTYHTRPNFDFVWQSHRKDWYAQFNSEDIRQWVSCVAFVFEKVPQVKVLTENDIPVCAVIRKKDLTPDEIQCAVNAVLRIYNQKEASVSMSPPEETNLRACFSWASTQEGHAYWGRIHKTPEKKNASPVMNATDLQTIRDAGLEVDRGPMPYTQALERFPKSRIMLYDTRGQRGYLALQPIENYGPICGGDGNSWVYTLKPAKPKELFDYARVFVDRNLYKFHPPENANTLNHSWILDTARSHIRFSGFEYEDSTITMELRTQYSYRTHSSEIEPPYRIRFRKD